MESGGASRYELTLVNRELFQTNGVIEVETFDERQVLAVSKLGPLLIKGEGLHITQLNLVSGQLVLEGEISSIQYVENRKDKMKIRSKGIMERLFK